MATPANDLETVLASAGIESEAAERLGVVLQQFVDEAVAKQSAPALVPLAASFPDATAERVIRIEQELIDLREILTVRFDAIDQRFDAIDRRFEEVDRRFEEVDRRFETIERRFEDVDRRFETIDRRFEEVDHRFGELNDRLDRERREWLGFVTTVAGAITAGLLRIFGAI